jgi:hypothetical protein
VFGRNLLQTGKRSELPRRIPLVTHMFASSEHAWDPMAILECNFLSENAHRTFSTAPLKLVGFVPTRDTTVHAALPSLKGHSLLYIVSAARLVECGIQSGDCR